MSDRAEELQRQLEARNAKAEKSSGPDWTKRIVWWPLTITDLRGKVFEGRFQSKVPDEDTKGLIDSLAAALANHTPWEALSPSARVRYERLASFRYCLTERPDWFKDPGSFVDPTVPVAVYSMIVQHYEGYFQLGPDPSGSAEEDAVADREVPPLEG